MRSEEEADRNVMRRLGTRLRQEAAAERPGFSPERHARLLARVVPGPTARATERRRRIVPAAVAGGLAVAVAVAIIASRSPEQQTGKSAASETGAAVAADTPGIERLPTLDEMKEGVVESVTAALVDIPPWVDLVAVEPGEVP